MVDHHTNRRLRVAAISLDCLDPLALAEFYMELLDGVELWRSERSVGLRVQGAVLAMQRVDIYQSPTWPGAAAMHLDLTAGDDLDRSEARALELGATLAKFSRILAGGCYSIRPDIPSASRLSPRPNSGPPPIARVNDALPIHPFLLSRSRVGSLERLAFEGADRCETLCQ